MRAMRVNRFHYRAIGYEPVTDALMVSFRR
jgi:hypothetical protein